jgi:hypothetical protein
MIPSAQSMYDGLEDEEKIGILKITIEELSKSLACIDTSFEKIQF